MAYYNFQFEKKKPSVLILPFVLEENSVPKGFLHCVSCIQVLFQFRPVFFDLMWPRCTASVFDLPEMFATEGISFLVSCCYHDIRFDVTACLWCGIW